MLLYIFFFLVQTMLGAGTETSSTTLEWAMSLLLNHPEAMKKASDEIDRICGRDKLIEEQDLPKLTYLHNVVTETLRLFPPTPLLLPHESSEECHVSGFRVPRGTMLLVNIWAIQRDPELWEDPDAFKPERFFQGSSSEAASDDDGGYKMMPFGAGRRACPGANLGRRMVMLALGAMIQCFEWGRVGEEEIDMGEGTGLTMPKAKILEALWKPRPNILSLLS